MSTREPNRVVEIMASTLPLSYEELIDLHHLIVDRLEYLEHKDTQQKMLEFTPGCRISFESKFGRETGVITKFNRKTVSVVTDSNAVITCRRNYCARKLRRQSKKPALVIHSRKHKK